jgi:hypothetical protein
MEAEHAGAGLAERLERGEVICYASAPFPLPQGPEHDFLLQQHLAGPTHKNISYDPATGRVSGFVRQGGDQEDRLRTVFAAFSAGVTAWLGQVLPRYCGGCVPDRASFRPVEEATRRLRPTARNDLLHVDAFRTRPALGRRLLRVFANVNEHEPRVWATSEPFARLLARYGAEVGVPGWLQQFGERVRGLLRPARASAYDCFMRRFHDFLKGNEEFQQRGPKRLWRFGPGSAWLAMTDACTYAELRGRFALEHSYFVLPEVLALPEEAPAALLAAARARPGRAA